ncbi:hypothetical protein [Micromonospora rubida]|uniref:hypothetical protein n=1 Tax=Micromonospora rubida TaxID=2697657 RepID=UPI00137687F3|nr:hypothetical protein [Micromonospora rubida]NBE79803.1 hypothetical protein [Micromonospora rubida]
MADNEFGDLAASIQWGMGAMLEPAGRPLPEQVVRLCARTVAEWDPGRRVQATVRLDGLLEGLLIAPYARRDLTPERLAAACEEALAAARASSVRLLAEGLHELTDFRKTTARA